MTDEWTDRKKKTIFNFLVNSPRETVVLKSIDAFDICKTIEKIFKMMDVIYLYLISKLEIYTCFGD